MSSIWAWDAHWAVRVPIVVIWAVILPAAAVAHIIEGLIVLIAIGIIWLIGLIMEPSFSTSWPSLGVLVSRFQPPPFR